MHPIWTGAATPAPDATFALAAARLGAEEAAVRAVAEVESARGGWRRDGTLERKPELHHLPESWWPRIGFTVPEGMPAWKAAQPPRRGPLPQREAEAMAEKVMAEDLEAGLRCWSMGWPQTMGFNHERAGFRSAEAMARAYAGSDAAQFDGFVRFVESDRRLLAALRARDWIAFARAYNGGGKVADYAARVESAYRRLTGGAASPEVLRLGASGPAVRALQQALGIDPDGTFGPKTEAAVRAFQEGAGLVVDGVAGARTWAALTARAGAAAPPQPDQIDRMLERITKGSAAGTAVTATLNGLTDGKPESVQLVIWGIVGVLALVFAGAAALRWARARPLPVRVEGAA